MKAFTFRSLLFVFIFITMAMLLFTLPAMAGTGTEVVTGILISIIGSPVIQGAMVFALLAILAWLFQKNTNALHVVNLAILAYEYAEKQGLAQKLKGYQKFDPFMDKFISEYKLKFGTDPDPTAKGLAVKTMEQKVLEANSPGK